MLIPQVFYISSQFSQCQVLANDNIHWLEAIVFFLSLVWLQDTEWYIPKEESGEDTAEHYLLTSIHVKSTCTSKSTYSLYRTFKRAKFC